MKKISLIIILANLLALSGVSSQNLVRNSSFEIYNDGQYGENPFYDGEIENWFSAQGTPQLQNPDNALHIDPHIGLAAPFMVASYVSYKNDITHFCSEGIFQNINFQSCKLYTFECWIRNSDYVRYLTLTDYFISLATGLQNNQEFSCNIQPNFLDSMIIYHGENLEVGSWQKITTSFIPNKNYRQLWIYPKQTVENSHFSQFTIDDISIEETKITAIDGNIVCYSGIFSFSLPPLPEGATIEWDKSDNIEIISGQETTLLRVRAKNNYVSGSGWVLAEISTEYCSFSLSKEFWVGSPAQPTTNPSGYPTVEMGIGSMMPIWITSSPGAYGSSYIWEISGSIEEVSNIGHTCTVEATDYGWGNFWVQTTNQCGISPKGGGSVNVTSDGGGGLPVPKSFKVFPNPTSNLLTIEINDDAPNAEYYGSAEKELYLYDNAMQPVRRKKFNGKQTMLNIRSLRPDVYLLIVKTGEEQFSEKIVKSQ